MHIFKKNYYLGLSLIVNSLILIFFVVFVLQYLPGHENIDYIKHYNPIALNILNGLSYDYYNLSACDGCVSMENISAKRPPIFPIFIALTYYISDLINLNQLDVLIYSQYLMHLVSSTFIFLIYRRWFKSNLIPFLASLIYSSYPLGLYLLKQPNSEVIFNFLLVSFILVFTLIIKDKKYLRGYCLLFSGLLLGLLVLTRFLSIALPIFICIYLLIFFRENILINISKVLLGFLLVFAPWQLYSNSLIITNSELDLLEKPREFSTTVLVYGLIWESMPERSQSKAVPYMSNNLKLFMNNISKKYFQEGQLRTKSETFSYLINEGVKSPLTIIELSFWKLSRAIYGTDTKRHEFKVLILNSLYLFLLFLLYLRRKNYFPGEIDKRFPILFLFILFYFILFSALSIPLVRYSTPGFLISIPLIALLFQRSKKLNT